MGRIPCMPKASLHTDTIHHALSAVAQLRQERATRPALARAVSEIKALQSRRFSGTYADVLRDPAYTAAARFFLEELYADRDFADRDAQFARVAGTLQKLFPAAVVSTACALAELHALTEQLDQAMAHERLVLTRDGDFSGSESMLYLKTWRKVEQEDKRRLQLQNVLAIGNDLARLTRTPGLRTLLKMMRRPANAAGMGMLQQFLESGFDTFAALAKQPGGASHFLELIAQRENALIDTLFHAPIVGAEAALDTILMPCASQH